MLTTAHCAQRYNLSTGTRKTSPGLHNQEGLLESGWHCGALPLLGFCTKPSQRYVAFLVPHTNPWSNRHRWLSPVSLSGGTSGATPDLSSHRCTKGGSLAVVHSGAGSKEHSVENLITIIRPTSFI